MVKVRWNKPEENIRGSNKIDRKNKNMKERDQEKKNIYKIMKERKFKGKRHWESKGRKQKWRE